MSSLSSTCELSRSFRETTSFPRFRVTNIPARTSPSSRKRSKTRAFRVGACLFTFSLPSRAFACSLIGQSERESTWKGERESRTALPSEAVTLRWATRPLTLGKYPKIATRAHLSMKNLVALSCARTYWRKSLSSLVLLVSPERKFL